MTESKQDSPKGSGSSVKEKVEEVKVKAKPKNGRRKDSRSAKAKSRPQSSPQAKATKEAGKEQAKAPATGSKGTSEKAEKIHEKAIAEVREIREENEKRWAVHERVVVQREIPTQKGKLLVVTADGLTYINDIVLDHDQLVTLRQTLDAAFQAVS